MNIVNTITNDELLLKWFKYMYYYETDNSCNDINTMISDLRNHHGLSDGMIMTMTKSSYPRNRICK